MAKKTSRSEDLKKIRASLDFPETTPPHIRLRRIREEAGMSRRELADELSEALNRITDPGTIRRWEEPVSIPDPQYRRQLRKLFGIPAYAWLESRDQIKKDGIQPSGPSQQEGLSVPLLHIPYTRNPCFLDQRNLVQSLRQRLTAEQSGATRQAISGLGGIGKTQLALAYAYQYQTEYSAVLWVGASTQAQMFQDFVDIGKLLHVPASRKSGPQQRFIVKEVLSWLRTRSDWLLILDNVEEELDKETAETASEEDALTLADLLRISDRSHIVITTRSQVLAHRVQNLLLEEMQPEERAQLLLLREGQSPSSHLLDTAGEVHRTEVFALSELLGGLPLALEQARAYIEATECGFAGYRQLYESSRKELLQSVASGSRLEKEYRESVATTWLISFRHVEQQFPLASDVLTFYAYVAPDAIPEGLLLKGAEKVHGGLRQLAGNKILFNRVCETLLNYSLIKRDADEALLSIHRLVQAVLQDHLDDKMQLYWTEQVVRAVEHVFSYATDTDIERYIPHAQLCAHLIERYSLKGEEAAVLLKMVANAVDERGWYAQAQPLYVQAFYAYRDQFGMGDHRTFHLLNDVLTIHSDMGSYQFSIAEYKRMIEELKQVHGPDHPDILFLLNHLAWVQIAAGKFEDAAQTVADAWQLLERIPNVDPVECAKTCQVMAEIQVAREDRDRANSFYQAALTLFEQTLGPDDEEVANTLANWSAFQLHCKNFDQAETLIRQALDIRRRTCGNNHPKTADGLLTLAFVTWGRKHYAEAEEYFRQILAIRQQTLGPRNPDVVQTLRHLALLSAQQKKNEEAERYFRDALALIPSDGEVISTEYELVREEYIKFLNGAGRIEEAKKYES